MRETDFVAGRWINAVVYGILEDDFRRGTGPDMDAKEEDW
jgi:hypothetical protein